MLSSNGNFLSIATPRSFSVLEILIAVPFIFIVTGLYGGRKKENLDAFVLKLLY